MDNLGINLWAVDLQTIDLLANQATYDLDNSTVDVLDVYRTEVGSGIDIIMAPLSRTDYASQPNKLIPGVPTSFWVNRQTPTPQMNIWQVASEDGQYQVKFYRMRQLMQATPQMEQTADIPIRFMEALCAGLASHLAIKWKPDKAAALMQYSDKVWAEAAIEDVERVPLRILPKTDGYWM